MRVIKARRRTVDAPQLLDGVVRVGGRLGDRPAYERRGQPFQVVIGDAVRTGRERRVAHRYRSEWVEVSRQMAVTANRFDEVRGADDNAGIHPRPGGWRRRGLGRPALESLARLWINRLGILPVPLVELENVRGIHSRELFQVHNLLIVTRLVCPSR